MNQPTEQIEFPSDSDPLLNFDEIRRNIFDSSFSDVLAITGVFTDTDEALANQQSVIESRSKTVEVESEFELYTYDADQESTNGYNELVKILNGSQEAGLSADETQEAVADFLDKFKAKVDWQMQADSQISKEYSENVSTLAGDIRRHRVIGNDPMKVRALLGGHYNEGVRREYEKHKSYLAIKKPSEFRLDDEIAASGSISTKNSKFL